MRMLPQRSASGSRPERAAQPSVCEISSAATTQATVLRECSCSPVCDLLACEQVISPASSSWRVPRLDSKRRCSIRPRRRPSWPADPKTRVYPPRRPRVVSTNSPRSAPSICHIALVSAPPSMLYSPEISFKTSPVRLGRRRGMTLRAALRDDQRQPDSSEMICGRSRSFHLHLIRRDERGGIFLPSTRRSPASGAAPATHTPMSISPSARATSQQRSAS